MSAARCAKKMRSKGQGHTVMKKGHGHTVLVQFAAAAAAVGVGLHVSGTSRF